MPPAKPASTAPPAIRGVFAFDAAPEIVCATPPPLPLLARRRVDPAVRLDVRCAVDRFDRLRERGAAREPLDRLDELLAREEPERELLAREEPERLRVEPLPLLRLVFVCVWAILAS
jgi:hypothetical protein